ncbi:hypothetical protein ANCCEY_14936 [Ancylostoma ceylanicum]|uniref:Uncharacterized protein n=1 Tax=Ancylostoma ceylanicum TaxID=53326 RepID=A0A0D6L8M2_9BILA|nr:hypothetical protein ANCCEY_14936 [Ancylostoma ceylanicum]
MQTVCVCSVFIRMKLKNALKQLQEDYLKSKDANPIMRYMKLQQSVRDVSDILLIL